ncbi:hypothetical protein BGX20_004603 [Mortierella sp. AD010]|nr:hypothetical protein BGX20_004603 [Mortierella sp. AD010]
MANVNKHLYKRCNAMSEKLDQDFHDEEEEETEDESPKIDEVAPTEQKDIIKLDDALPYQVHDKWLDANATGYSKYRLQSPGA